MIFLLSLLKAFLMINKNNFDLYLLFFFCIVYQSISTFFSLGDDNILHWLEAIRLNSGQLIYNDFYVPWGPISSLIPYLSLKLTDSLGYSMIIVSVLYNYIAGLLVYLIIYYTTYSKNLSRVSSILTLAWFGIFIGGWYVDHVSYLITLFASFLFIKKFNYILKFILIGSLLALSLVTKQTTGFISSLILFILIIFYPSEKKIYEIISMIFGGLIILLIFVLYIVIFSNADVFIDNFYRYPIEYSINEPNKNPIVLIKNIFIPFNINIISALKDLNKGLIIFYPTIIFIYLSYIVYFKYKIFKINNYFNFFFNFFLFSSLACGPMIGRNYSDVFWTFGAVFTMTNYLLIKNNNRYIKIISYFPIYFVLLSFITFSYPKIKDIKTFYHSDQNYIHPIPITNKSMPFIKFDDFIETDKFIKSLNIDKNTKFYVLDDHSLFFILTNKINNIAENLYFDLNINIPRNKKLFLEWVNKQVDQINKHEPQYIINSTKNSKRLFRVQNNNFEHYNIDILDLNYFNDFVSEKYSLIFQNNTYEIFEFIE